MSEPVNALIALAHGDYCGKCKQYPCEKAERFYDAPCELYGRRESQNGIRNDDEQF